MFGHKIILRILCSLVTFSVVALVLPIASVHAVPAPPSLETATSASLAPANIVYSVPITLTNSQSVATPDPFQEMITVNSSTYSSYEATNLQNVEFYDSAGAVITSWLESGNSNSSTNTVYWLKITNGIAASSSTTVNMGFASPSTNLFNSDTTGEAPQLSPTYGEYDDGAVVFQSYFNFGGTSLPSGWTQATWNTGSVEVNKGLSLSTAGTTYTGAVVESNVTTPSSSVIEGGVSSFSNGGNSQVMAMVASSSSSASMFQATAGGYQPDSVGWQNDIGGPGLLIENNNGGTASVVATSSIDPSAPFILGTYGNTLYVNYQVGATVSENILGAGYLSIAVNSGTSVPSIVYDWIRVRAYPPNGAMPGATFGGTSATPGTYQVGFGYEGTSFWYGIGGTHEQDFTAKGVPIMELEDNNGLDQGSLSIGSNVSLNTNLILNNNYPVLPDWLYSFLGISTAWYAVRVTYPNDPDGQNPQFVKLVQFNTGMLSTVDSYPIDLTLPADAPTNLSQLYGYSVRLEASQSSDYAELADFINCVMALAGVSVSQFLEDKGFENAFLHADYKLDADLQALGLSSLTLEQVAGMTPLQLDQYLESILPQAAFDVFDIIGNYLSTEASSAAATKAAQEIANYDSEISADAASHAIALFKAAADAGFDLVSIALASWDGNIYSNYQIQPYAVLPAALPTGSIDVGYGPQTLTVSGGADTAWSWSPTNLTRNYFSFDQSTGVLTGLPATADTYEFTVNTSNTLGSATQLLSVVVTPGVITPILMPSGQVGVSYTQPLAAFGGLPPYSWKYAGNLPPGLELERVYIPPFGYPEAIAGTPTETGTFNFTIQATGVAGQVTVNRNYSIIVNPNFATSLVSIQNGDASAVQDDGVSVDMTGSTATDGTSVTIASEVYGSTQSSGTGTIELNGSAFYDVSISSNVTLGATAIARVSITDSSVKSNTIIMYWDGNGWSSANNTSVSGSTVSGDIPVADLQGTPIVIGVPTTETTLISSANPSTYGQPVAFTANVTGLPPATTIPTGNVTFTDNGIVLAQVPLNASGNATFTTSNLTAGSHLITATYDGDSTFAGSSANVTQVVNRAQTSLIYNGEELTSANTTLLLGADLSNASDNASVSGLPVSFYLDDDPSPGQSVTGGYLLGSGITDSNGQANLSIPSMTTANWITGAYEVTANFTGTNNFLPSSDSSVLTVGGPGDSADGGGWYTLNGSGRANFGFVVEAVPDTSPVQYRGEVLFMNTGKWRLKGTLDTYSVSDTQGSADGTGSLYWWNQTLNGGLGDWQMVNDGSAVPFAITFTSGQSGHGKKSSTGTFGIIIDYSITPSSGLPAGYSVLPNSSPQNLKGGSVTIR